MKKPEEALVPPTAQDLIDAGLDLIAQSQLSKLDSSGLLYATNELDFEATVSTSDHQYKRLASWILFSTGAEYIVKGVCLAFDIGEIRPHVKTGEPALGTLTPYYRSSSQTDQPYLMQLATKIAEPNDVAEIGEELTQWCENLANIRNREVHIFIRNVRGSRNFPPLGSGLLRLLNYLLETYNKRMAAKAG